MRLKLEPRAEPSRLMGWLSPLIAAALTIVAGFILFVALGKNPVQAFYTFFIHPIRDWNGVAELLLKASPLMLIGVGLATAVLWPTPETLQAVAANGEPAGQGALSSLRRVAERRQVISGPYVPVSLSAAHCSVETAKSPPVL